MGVLICGRNNCMGIARPQTKLKRLQQQLLEERCTLDACEGVFIHVECFARSEIHTGDNTVTFKHFGHHDHIPPPKIHINIATAKQFTDTVLTNPSATPVKLITGAAPGPGPGQSVAFLDESFNNAGRVAYYRSSVLANGAVPRVGGDKFIDSLHTFATDHPDFIQSIKLTPFVLITMQTPYMASEMIKEITADEGPCGLVTDASYGFWSDEQKYLFVTVTYSIRLHGWVPIVFAYSGGQTVNHYREYFLELFVRIRQCVGAEIELRDEFYAQVNVKPLLNIRTH